jgi:hypothetical protein
MQSLFKPTRTLIARFIAQSFVHARKFVARAEVVLDVITTCAQILLYKTWVHMIGHLGSCPDTKRAQVSAVAVV